MGQAFESLRNHISSARGTISVVSRVYFSGVGRGAALPVPVARLGAMSQTGGGLYEIFGLIYANFGAFGACRSACRCQILFHLSPVFVAVCDTYHNYIYGRRRPPVPASDVACPVGQTVGDVTGRVAFPPLTVRLASPWVKPATQDICC